MATTPKHWVRIHAWLPVAIARYQRCGRPIRYFTLTTASLLDVKVLERAGVLEKNARGYPGLGFCEMDDKAYGDIVRNIGWCGWSYKGLFEDMVIKHPDFETLFDFDAVNLDFIGVPFPHHEAPLKRTWEAIQRMLDVQWSHRTSFDLFVTFRGSREETDAGALQQVADLLKNNLRVGRGQSELRSRIGHTDIDRLLQDNYPEFLCLGLPKLLIADALQDGYLLTRFDTYQYARGEAGGTYHIVTFIFSFEVPASSGSDFAQPPPLVSSYDEAILMIFGRQVGEVANELHGDPSLAAQLDQDLLVLARRQRG